MVKDGRGVVCAERAAAATDRLKGQPSKSLAALTERSFAQSPSSCVCRARRACLSLTHARITTTSERRRARTALYNVHFGCVGCVGSLVHQPYYNSLNKPPSLFPSPRVIYFSFYELLIYRFSRGALAAIFCLFIYL